MGSGVAPAIWPPGKIALVSEAKASDTYGIRRAPAAKLKQSAFNAHLLILQFSIFRSLGLKEKKFGEKIKPHGLLVLVSFTGYPRFHAQPINVVVYDRPLVD